MKNATNPKTSPAPADAGSVSTVAAILLGMKERGESISQAEINQSVTNALKVTRQTAGVMYGFGSKQFRELDAAVARSLKEESEITELSASAPARRRKWEDDLAEARAMADRLEGKTYLQRLIELKFIPSKKGSPEAEKWEATFCEALSGADDFTRDPARVVHFLKNGNPLDLSSETSPKENRPFLVGRDMVWLVRLAEMAWEWSERKSADIETGKRRRGRNLSRTAAAKKQQKSVN